jgi:hypothetical protein
MFEFGNYPFLSLPHFSFHEKWGSRRGLSPSPLIRIIQRKSILAEWTTFDHDRRVLLLLTAPLSVSW